MANKKTRAGKKYCGTHTSLIPASVKVCDLLNKSDFVKKISIGFIKTGLRPNRGNKRVKFLERKSSILLTIRDNISQQEISVFVIDNKKAKKEIEKLVKNLGYDFLG